MVYNRIKAYIKANGIKQGWLAAQIKMPASKLSEILLGKRPLYADVLTLICDALCVSSELFTKAP